MQQTSAWSPGLSAGAEGGLTLDLGVLGHEQEPPSQRGGCGVRASSKQVHDGEQKVVLVEMAADSRLLWETEGWLRHEVHMSERRPHLQTLHVDHESVGEPSALLRIQGLF